MSWNTADAAGALPDATRVLDLLRASGCPWPEPIVLARVGSTNADVLQLAADGAKDGTCEVAGEQTAGRGRHGRSWVSAPGAGLWSSTLLAEGADPARTPILAALAVVDAFRAREGPEVSIKWPNDVLTADGRKIAGILAERCERGVVVGIGINLAHTAQELPTAIATSWVQETGSVPDRSVLLAALLSALYTRVRQGWVDALAEYRERCITLGRQVRVHLPGGEEWVGEALDIDSDGHLVVRQGQNLRTVIAGDVVHATIAP